MAGFILAAIAAVTGALTAQPQAASPPEDHPAMWMVQDSDTTVYLFGTFHALDGRSEWFNPQVRTAFSNSNELVLETLLPKLDQRRAPRPTSSVTPSASFLGATRMAVTAGKDRGLDVRKGADMVLRRAAEESGKPVRGLESVEFQIGMLNRMNGPAPVAGAPVEMDGQAHARLAAIMTQMQAAWKAGDQRIFATMLDQMRTASPDNYRIMFPERNARWASWIAGRMAQPGVVFVAVGAGHFAGPDSVLANLAARGLHATRLD